MNVKSILNKTRTSYSQFLRTHEIHSLSDDSHLPSLDIEFFKRSISLHYQHLYSTKKWQSWLYRLVFFALGIVFFILGSFIYFKTTNYACGLYFSNCGLIKNFLNIASYLFALGAFVLAYKIHPEKDAVRYLAGKVEQELNSPGKQMQIEFNAIFANIPEDWVSQQQTFCIRRTLNPLINN